jgi:hypothetical protein
MPCVTMWDVRTDAFGYSGSLMLDTGAVVARAPVTEMTLCMPKAWRTAALDDLYRWFAQRGKLIVDMSRGRAVVS